MSTQLGPSSPEPTRPTHQAKPVGMSAKLFSSEWLSQNSRTVLFFLLGIGLIIIGIGLFKTYKENRESEAREALFLAKKTYDEEFDQHSRSKEKKEAGKLRFQKLNVEEKFSKSLTAYQKTVQEFKNTLAGFQAAVAIANLYFDHGMNEKAIIWYDAAIQKSPSLSEKAGLLVSLALAEENLGKFEQAIQTLEKAFNLGVGGLKGDILLAQARCYTLIKNPQKAKEVYQKIITEMPGSSFAKTAGIYLGQ